MAKNENERMKEIVSLCKRRGLIYPSSEIYGGFANTWDYGPYGVLLKNNVKAAWWETMVKHRSDIVGLDSAILMNPKVWEASGHVTEFTDPMVDCKQCKHRFKGDDPALSLRGGTTKQSVCPECKGELTPARQFNLMFQTNVGPVTERPSSTEASGGQGNIAYLRPETAQGIFVNFKNVLDSTRVKLPFGIAQIGKAFRNEITPGNFTFRTLEFEQCELEYFIDPKDADDTFKYWAKEREKWFHTFGINSAKIRTKPHTKEDLAHYAKAATDVQYEFPFGWSELEGIHNRGDFDLTQHAKFSGQELEYTDDEGKKLVPYVVETSVGVDRATLAFLVDAYATEQVKKKNSHPELVSGSETDDRVVLRLHPKLAPIKAAILPLVRKEPLLEISQKLYEELRKEFFVEYDESGTVGKRYRRQDEIGTPYCFTIDFDTVASGPTGAEARWDDMTVTVRDRDSMEQERVPIASVAEFLRKKLA